MRGYLSHHILLLLLLIVCTTATAQQDSSRLGKLLSLPDKVFGKIDHASQKLSQHLDKQTEKYLSRLEKQEQKLKRKLWRTDSLKAKELFGNVEERYASLRNKLTGNEQQQSSSVYSAHADSLTTALNFLNENPALKTISKNLSSNLANVTALQNKFNQTEVIRKQIKQRQEQLKQQLANTPLAKEFAKFKKQTYYYQAQLNEYRQALNDPKTLGPKLIEAAKKIPAFDAFFKRNSELARLFALPGAGASADANFLNNPNLQTRVQVGQMIQQQFAAAGSSSQQYIQQNVSAAQSQLNVLKQKVLSYGTGASDEEMPDFKPNEEKTKSFKKRIELGSNFQTTRNNTYFPITTDIAFSAGYKLNNKSIVGIGGSYKMGWGTGFNNISFTSQGAGIRSFIDWKAPFQSSKIKLLQGLWISGGYEQNYLAVFRRLDELNNRTVWKQSALIGVSKVIDIRSRLFKQTKIQLLYDFLWRQQLPQTQAVLIRFGYNF